MKHTYCVDCGKKIFEGIVFCPNCGAKQTSSFSKEEIRKSPYTILQVSENAESEVIKAAYKSLSKKYHPDIDSSLNAQEKMKDINWAYSILRDPDKRKEWDISYIRSRPQPSPPQSQKSASKYSAGTRVKQATSQSKPEKPRTKKQPVSSTARKKTEQAKDNRFEVVVIVLFVIGATVALCYGSYFMNATTPSSSDRLVLTPNLQKTVAIGKPTNTFRPPTATPLPSSIIPPYFEDFSSGPGVWYVGEDDEASFTLSNEQYIIKALGEGVYSYVGAILDNVIFEFTTKFLYSYPTPEAGFFVYFRCNFPSKDECYSMAVNEQGYLGVTRGDDLNYLVTEKPSAKINLYNHPNEWAIVMDGPNFEIHCNGELITTFSDNNYKRGDIGFGVYNSIGVVFDNIRVSKIR
jgi:uncharacterized Zn finger protein (UPF0148 family)